MGKFNQLEQLISDNLDDAFGDAQRAEVSTNSLGEPYLKYIRFGPGECIPIENLPALKADILNRLKELLS